MTSPFSPFLILFRKISNFVKYYNYKNMKGKQFIFYLLAVGDPFREGGEETAIENLQISK